MSIVLRLAHLDDLNRIRRISTDTFMETFADQNSSADMADYVATSFAPAVLAEEINNPCSSFFLLLLDGELAGYLKVNVGSAQTEDLGPDAMEVERIYTLTKFKRRGLGTLMIQRAIDEARRKDLNKLWLGVWEHNISAQVFYEHLGFRTTGSHVFTLGGEDQTDLIMELSLKTAVQETHESIREGASGTGE